MATHTTGTGSVGADRIWSYWMQLSSALLNSMGSGRLLGCRFAQRAQQDRPGWQPLPHGVDGRHKLRICAVKCSLTQTAHHHSPMHAAHSETCRRKRSTTSRHRWRRHRGVPWVFTGNQHHVSVSYTILQRDAIVQPLASRPLRGVCARREDCSSACFRSDPGLHTMWLHHAR